MARARTTTTNASIDKALLEADNADEILADHDLEIGQEVKVEGDSETYKVRKVNRDGSVDVIGPCGFRSFQPDWLFPAQRTNNRGRVVPNKCPAEKKGLRAAWLAEHGIIRADLEEAS